MPAPPAEEWDEDDVSAEDARGTPTRIKVAQVTTLKPGCGAPEQKPRALLASDSFLFIYFN